MPKISVIVPVYNTEKYLEECLNSLINQTYKNIEIVCINDASEDNSLKILEKYRKKDNRIIVINQKNSGANISRTNGISKSTGDYLMFVDSDDWIIPNTISELVNKIEKTNADIIKFDFINRKSLRNIEKKIYVSNDKKYLYKKLLTTYELNNLTTEIVNRNVCNIEAEVFKNKSSVGEDLLMNLEMYDRADKILIIDDCYYFYRKNNNSTTNTNKKEKLYANMERKDEIYLYKYAKKWNMLTESLGNEILLRRFQAKCIYIMKILQNRDLEKEDFDILNNIIDNNEVIREIRIRRLDPKVNDNILNKKIIKLILEKKYEKARKLIEIKQKIIKLFFRR